MAKKEQKFKDFFCEDCRFFIKEETADENNRMGHCSYHSRTVFTRYACDDFLRNKKK